ncbi:MAG: Hsp20/alpha crystallin family protein [Phycisphaerales bacterium]|nr:Hsp20/alpha crystallin family protein [Phycisphaerae bacterium]NNF43286.1 Hsp20/alpha crystallin family protein [Phycisphaerales bacterium]NNM27462.1 Hsp20/alpha crystallin family protein [Phycisphaerales bacterium]
MTAGTSIQKTAPQAVEVNAAPTRRNSWTYRPNVDIFDAAEELTVIADMPGASPDSIDVSLESGILTLQADITTRHHPGAQALGQEYGIGGFHRRFEIDESIDAEAVSADYRDGTLTIHLPKAQQARRRRIPVST